ncbi:CsbD family protein [Hyphococcus flavus]|uniref:CsbD family protein n=1 Tax=Hyphococcus flavus TaxID=1866326 RepID=A0AAF0CF51_9PROT|nr:CsbD family protein [Hyphococcus flavus]WDI31064.1 CsbD family protein [Hyphococcus flavus]
MNDDQIKGKWTQLKGKAKETWGELTDNDLMEVEGDVEKLTGKLQERYGIEREEAKKRIDEWRAQV